MATNTKYSFTPTSEEVIYIAGKLAKEQNHASVSPAHLLTAALNKNFGLRNTLQQNDVDVYYLEDWAAIRMEQLPKGASAHKEPEWEPGLHTLFTEAENNAHLFHSEAISPEAIFYALSIPGVAFSYDQLKTFPIDSGQFLSFASKGNKTGSVAKAGTNGSPIHSGSKSDGVLGQFTIDLVTQLQDDNNKPFIGRSAEVRKLIEIISRKRKSSVVIVGESGVGKTALMDCFGYAIIQNETPDFIKEWPVLKLQTHAIIAGATYKGEIEDRLQKVFKALEAYPKSVLLIDDIHLFLDAQQKNTGLSGMLKVILEKDSTTIIATTSNENYRKLIESDTGLYRSFEKISINEPALNVAEEMLNNVLEKYESYHQVQVEEATIHNVVKLAHRYLYTRRLPDSGIDLLDRSMAVFRIMKNTSRQRIEQLQEKFKALDNNATEQTLDYFYQTIQNSLTPTLLARLADENSYFTLKSVEEKQQYIRGTLQKLYDISVTGFDKMSVDDVVAVLINLTGISIGKMQSDEKEKLMQMQDILRSRVIGQDVAVSAVNDAILESRSGLNKEGQPIASFFFLGPTGTGKTELAKALAQFLFQDESTIIRFDMSEFKEEHSAALLYGAPPGYVGYEEGGLLVNKIRKQPYSIVLFDEIEKAHPSVFDIFLQILDEGKLTDKLGNIGNFTNAVILFTSNIGADYIIQSFVEGKVPPQNQLLEKMTGYFRPEFLARITEIVPFAPIPEENVVKIFDIHLKPLIKQLAQQQINFAIDSDAKTWLAMQGYSPKYGVRPLKNIIRTGIRKPLSKLIVSESLKPGQTVHGKLTEIDNETKINWEISDN
ncbi:AAA family ATPase [Polluticaenibacter yanchengensis]|uniref:ATP-dependent Clp protease ATP-binding subunit n=1 Tax=Polluticaenibacter yanchengensis TaxID=3014562 RepID=A0ABT4UFS7_9BACT|nr:ATP-dependent Clp protease ATP-binding subunit [Chitinophagaceae bacterium LY-5]